MDLEPNTPVRPNCYSPLMIWQKLMTTNYKWIWLCWTFLKLLIKSHMKGCCINQIITALEIKYTSGFIHFRYREVNQLYWKAVTHLKCMWLQEFHRGHSWGLCYSCSTSMTYQIVFHPQQDSLQMTVCTTEWLSQTKTPNNYKQTLMHCKNGKPNGWYTQASVMLFVSVLNRKKLKDSTSTIALNLSD